MAALGVLLVGYVLGSIPFGLILTRAAGLGDVRQIGSGNIGATNVLRTGNKGLAAATLLLDGLKGTAAVFAAWRLAPWLGAGLGKELLVFVLAAPWIAAFGAFLGHVFPIWLGFKGGKGVATYIGGLAGAYWPGALLFCACWLIVAFVTRFSSLAALVSAGVVAIYFLATGGLLVAPIIAAMTALLVWTHRENIRRLLNGTESKIGDKASKPAG
jgi:glycerol-3-phosphate acyltransferase PlsY